MPEGQPVTNGSLWIIRCRFSQGRRWAAQDWFDVRGRFSRVRGLKLAQYRPYLPLTEFNSFCES